MKLGASAFVTLVLILAAISVSQPRSWAQPRPTDFDRVQEVFDTRCVRCHSGHTPPRGLDLTPGRSRTTIVGRPSSELPSMMLVDPGDPQNSYLFLKITDRHLEAGGSGRRCPIGQPPLPPSEVDSIRTWIRALAP